MNKGTEEERDAIKKAEFFDKKQKRNNETEHRGWKATENESKNEGERGTRLAREGKETWAKSQAAFRERKRKSGER